MAEIFGFSTLRAKSISRNGPETSTSKAFRSAVAKPTWRGYGLYPGELGSSYHERFPQSIGSCQRGSSGPLMISKLPYQSGRRQSYQSRSQGLWPVQLSSAPPPRGSRPPRSGASCASSRRRRRRSRSGERTGGRRRERRRLRKNRRPRRKRQARRSRSAPLIRLGLSRLSRRPPLLSSHEEVGPLDEILEELQGPPGPVHAPRARTGRQGRSVVQRG